MNKITTIVGLFSCLGLLAAPAGLARPIREFLARSSADGES